MSIDPNQALTEKEKAAAQQFIASPVWARMVAVAMYDRPKGTYMTEHSHQSIGSFAEERGFIEGIEAIRATAMKDSLEVLVGGKQESPVQQAPISQADIDALTDNRD